MAKGVKIPFTISGLRQAREDLEKLNEEIEKTQDVKASQKLVKQYNERDRDWETVNGILTPLAIYLL